MLARHATLGLFACVMIATGASCSLLTSFDGFNGGTAGGDGSSSGGDEHAAPEAADRMDTGSSSSSDGTMSDTGSDSSSSDAMNDAGAVADTGVDSRADSSAIDSGAVDAPASDSGDAGGPIPDAAGDAGSGWCAKQSPSHLFCDDFDEAPLTTGFDAIGASQCTLQLASGNATSPPQAMSATSKSGIQTFNCGASKAFPGLGVTPTTYTLAFDVYPAQVDQGGNSDNVAAVIQLSDSSGTLWALQLELYYNPGTVQLDVELSEDTEFPDGGEAFNSTKASAPLAMATWTRVTLELIAGAQNVPQTGKLLFGGTQVASAVLHPTTTNPTTDFVLGFTYVGPQNTSWSVLYDNMTFDAK